MNIDFINKEFEKLSKIEHYINYKFEPRYKFKKGVKRHIYFDDLKNDFTDEINAYGFSPFIQETYSTQKRDKNIMSYKTNYLNQGLINYVKKKNEGIKQNDKLKVRPFTTSSMAESKSYKNYLQNKFIKLEDTVEKDEIFLKKALDNLARNKLNMSSEDLEFKYDDDKENSPKTNLRKSQMNKMNNVKSTFFDSRGLKIDTHQFASITNTNLINPSFNKLNYGNYVNNLGSNIYKEDANRIKKLVRLVNVNSINNNFEKKELKEEIYSKEIKVNTYYDDNRENPYLKQITKMHSINLNINKRANSSDVFKRLFNLTESNKINSRREVTSSIRPNDENIKPLSKIHLSDINIAMEIFSHNTKEKERKFKQSEKKIFKSRHSMLRKNTLI